MKVNESCNRDSVWTRLGIVHIVSYMYNSDSIPVNINEVQKRPSSNQSILYQSRVGLVHYTPEIRTLSSD